MKKVVLISVTAGLLTGCSSRIPQNEQIESVQPFKTAPTTSESIIAHNNYISRLETEGVFAESLTDAAWQTYAAFTRALNAGEAVHSRTIPPLYWTEMIKTLKPLYVYTHRANLVVVLSVSVEGEKGKYIPLPISYYLPQSGVDGFVFTPNPSIGSEYYLMDSMDFVRSIPTPRFNRKTATLNTEQKNVPLRDDLSADDFKAALIGRWTSVFTYENRRNILHLKFTRDGQIKMMVTETDLSQSRYSGAYTVTFDREPADGATTFATITVHSEDSSEVILSRVNFGMHNGIAASEDLVLRIDSDPYGALKKVD